jgi:copper(I)-binding protein
MKLRIIVSTNIPQLLFFFTVIILILTGNFGERAVSQENTYTKGNLNISSYYLRGTMQNRPAAAYMKIQNFGKKKDKLTKVSSPLVDTIEFHETRVEEGVAKMRQIPEIAVYGNSTVELKPGGLHLMLLGLKKTLVGGDTFNMTLKFEIAGNLNIKVPVKTFSSKKMKNGSHGSHKRKENMNHKNH